MLGLGLSQSSQIFFCMFVPVKTVNITVFSVLFLHRRNLILCHLQQKMTTRGNLQSACNVLHLPVIQEFQDFT